MGFIYNLGIQFTNIVLKCIAPFNTKIEHGVKGRNKTFSVLEQFINNDDRTIWFHCASLGEYEQGLPVFAKIRALYKDHKIVLTFFSPSGYLVKKDAPVADIVTYLPIDTKANAKRLIELVNPELTVFVKYDVWPNILHELKKRKLKAILISALFRENQAFFKFYGKQLREALFSFEHIFTQNELSIQLLKKINYHSATIAGDTRFDRVSDQLTINNKLEFIETFKGNNLCIVAGSTWPEGEDYFCDFINKEDLDEVKIIIAPHDIKSNRIQQLKSNLKKKTILFSEKEDSNLAEAKIFILDTIGLLSKVYSYADIAYVGGAIGNTGLHNTLEAAAFGIPIIIGSNHTKFPEANEMIKSNGMFSVKNKLEFATVLNNLIKDSTKRQEAGSTNSKYVQKNKGAVIQIIDYLRK